MFLNTFMGWTLGGGQEFNRECFREAFEDICGFDPGEAYLVMMEPAMEPAQNLPLFKLV